MLPPWLQPGNQQPAEWIPESGYDASEDTDDDEESSQRTKVEKVRKKPKNPKRRKYKIWVTINGKRQQASYWK